MSGQQGHSIQSVIDDPTDRNIEILIRSGAPKVIRQQLEAATFPAKITERPFDTLRVRVPQTAVKEITTWDEVDSIQVNQLFDIHGDSGN